MAALKRKPADPTNTNLWQACVERPIFALASTLEFLRRIYI
jgi:hypothetical protein